MVIVPRFRGFICTAAHPEGCHKSVKQQIEYIKSQGHFSGPKKVLIIGASTGYGLATRIAATFGAEAKTIGVFFERPAENNRTASPGWYNTAAFEQLAHQEGHYAKSINGDAFSKEIKQQTADLIRKDLGKVDLVIYSLAAPKRVHPETGEVFSSVLKPIDGQYSNKTVNAITGEVKDITIEPATEKQIENTVAVMGGEDWEMWIDFLKQENLLTDNVTTISYTYIGPELTHPIYKNGTIGRAKDHMQATADRLNEKLQATGGRAFMSVNKALVTQASSAIPVVPLYMSILFKVMKEQGTHEGCIEQMDRLLRDFVYADKMKVDEKGRVRVDDLEMQAEVQANIAKIWPQITTETIEDLSDIQGYRDDFHKLFGFGFNGIDYDADTETDIKIESI